MAGRTWRRWIRRSCLYRLTSSRAAVDPGAAQLLVQAHEQQGQRWILGQRSCLYRLARGRAAADPALAPSTSSSAAAHSWRLQARGASIHLQESHFADGHRTSVLLSWSREEGNCFSDELQLVCTGHISNKRAIARFWAAHVDDKVFVSWATIMLWGETEEEKSEGKKALFAVLETLEGALAKCSDGKGFFGGDTVGLLDIVLGSHLSWLKAAEVMSGEHFFAGDKTPLLAAWMARFTELDVVKAALPDVDKVVEFAKNRQARLAAAAAAAATS